MRFNKTNAAMWTGAAVLLFTTSAAADGLAVKTNQLPAKSRVQLQAEIAKFKQAQPKAFQEVRDVQGYRPETYRKFRNPVPMVGRELRRLGKSALLPMLNALAFEAPKRNAATEVEWRALKVGMLEAVGYFADQRSAPVLQAVFNSKQHAFVLQAAAEAMGSLCDGSSVEVLRQALAAGATRRAAAIRGLGECRSYEAAEVLAKELDKSTSATDAAQLARALGIVGSSWAWKAMGANRHAEGLKVRRLAAVAVVRSYQRFKDAAARDNHRFALTMCEHPKTSEIVAKEAVRADVATKTALQKIAQLVSKRTKR